MNSSGYQPVDRDAHLGHIISEGYLALQAIAKVYDARPTDDPDQHAAREQIWGNVLHLMELAKHIKEHDTEWLHAEAERLSMPYPGERPARTRVSSLPSADEETTHAN